MITQKEYNDWFKRMLIKHPLKPEYNIVEKSHEDIDYLSVIIAHPIDEEKNIEVSTFGKELTLFIWKHHEHHDSLEDDDHEKEFIELCDYIDDIIADKVFFSICYKDGRLTYGTSSYKIDYLLDRQADKIEIISWSGKNDKTIEN